MNIQLSISLLASNRIRSLERCLDSLKPLLQRVPSELIVVFTGTDEQVRETAARYTDRVVPFTWCGDFSKARNAGLSQAKGEWFLYLDDDEWFEDVEEICSFFLTGEYRNYASAFYIQRNYLDWAGTKFADFSAFRMAKRTLGLMFQNPIHEELVPGNGPCKYFQTVVHHYGYIKDTEQDPEKKQDRNIPLLLKDIQRRPGYLKNYLQVTREYFVKKDWAQADTYCRKGLALCREEETGYKTWLLVYLARISCKKNTPQQAAEEIRQLLEREAPCELVSLILYQLLIVQDMELREYEEALECGQRYAAALSHMEMTPGLWEQQSYGDITEKEVTDPERLLSVWLNGAAAALEKEDGKTARFFLSRLPWEEEFQLQQYYPLFDRWKVEYGPPARDLFLPLPENSSYLLLQRMLAGPKDDALFLRCMEEIDHPYLQEQVLREGLLRQKDLRVLVSKVDLGTWEGLVEAAVPGIPYTEMEGLWQAQAALADDYPLQGLRLKKLLLEKELFQGYLMGEAFLRTLKEYSECILSYYNGVYQEGIMKKDRYLLPADGRYADKVLQALEGLEQKQYAEAVRLFREGLRLYPRMTGVTREVLRQLLHTSEPKPGAAGEEFQQLAEQMKTALTAMLAHGQYAEAEAVVNQLTPLLPDDLELLRLRQRLFREKAT